MRISNLTEIHTSKLGGQMREPRYAIGQTVYVLPTVNHTAKVCDRYWHSSLKPEPSFVYKVEGSPAWFPECDLKSCDEMPGYLESIKDEDDLDWTDCDVDPDTGRAFRNGRWVTVNSTQSERFQLS